MKSICSTGRIQFMIGFWVVILKCAGFVFGGKKQVPKVLENFIYWTLKKSV